ncbi:Uncharacterised protein [Delftia tsuruhatensis]|uniref:DUF6916 family protein n=1 Tax=Delftia tsuruhatensis TaxID=180282 RepID=UPI001E6C6AA6|nr:hypothetical protein [Delftia tsuruhatensis]CAB5660449.1 Uncharacterised protein [Delftia tsuruhatensis]CAC9679875.1 Uncharacterised protein [Delftia tsuruhatensis]
MKTGRRAFMRAAGVLPAAVAVAAAPLAAPAATAQQLCRRHFQPLLGQDFSVEKSGVRLRLLALEDLPHAREGERSFSAVFELGDGVPPAQDTWEISHPALGRHAVFLSPGDARGRRVEAVFNRG